MRMWLLALFLVGCTQTIQHAPPGPPKAKGPKAPEFSLISPGGEKVEYVPGSHFQVTVVAFFSPTWNPDNADEMFQLTTLAQDMKGKDVRVIAIAYDEDPATVRGYLKAHPMPFEVAMGEARLYDSFDLKAVPTTLLVAPDGSVIERLEGNYPADLIEQKIASFVP